jgi:SAM-dependent methyltransferase
LTVIVACPVCGNTDFRLLRAPADLDVESHIRQRFVEARLGRSPAGLEAMDLTHFMHGDPAAVSICTMCGTLRRSDEPPLDYESDHYDSVLLRHLYRRYRNAFARKRHYYEPLLPSHAEVLEIGSHVGAFLETAEEWGWKPIGLDIGAETTAFARQQGGSVKQIALEDYSPRSKPLDAVFIWNCFEQLDDPRRTLAEAASRLARHGLLVLRVPNGDYYREHIFRERGPASLLSLGYNNLLGFPYLNGYNPASLKQLLHAMDFEPLVTLPASLLTPPYPEMKPSLEKEWRRVEAAPKRDGAAQSPWIEIAARRLE